jgi:uncharacterized protein YjcR
MVWKKKSNTHKKDGVLLMNTWSENDMFDVFLMRYFNGFKYKDIASLYNVSIERVRQVNQKAKFVLKRKYKIKLKMKENGEY